ncbi:3-hydroxyacyl-CoA dehydrogenase [Sporodiniella umbellata]|nr:3-hydroxyacyl-CoA dehydrogenase [Sporodiniella umbellata]
MFNTLPKTVFGKRAFSTRSALLKDIKSVTVIGAGLMGSGIVQVAAQAQHSVTMVDTSDKALENGHNIIAASLKRVARKQFKEDEARQKEFIEKTMSFIKTSKDAKDAAASSDLVVEAIVENVDIKRSLFKGLDQVAPAHTVFCSNTSSLSISKIAQSVSEERKKRFAGLHFFNPVPAMKLVEIVRTEQVTDEVMTALEVFSKSVGKTSVRCKDTPGFIVNRILFPYLIESYKMRDRGDASVEDIDTAMKLGAGMPMGPLELSDFVGLDTIQFILDGWRKEGNVDSTFTAPLKVVDELVSQGHLGRKSGKGFYDYTKK